MKDKFAFRICVAYEDYDAGLRAKAASQRLTAGLKPQSTVVSDIWKFEMLRQPPLREMAATGAARANLVIISANGAGELPSHVKTWLKTWLPREQHSPPTLVALLGIKGAGRVGVSPLAEYLRQRAAEKRMNLVCHSDEWPPPCTTAQTSGASSLFAPATKIISGRSSNWAPCLNDCG